MTDEKGKARLAFAGFSIIIIVICFGLFVWFTMEKQKVTGECNAGQTKINKDGTIYVCEDAKYKAKITVPTNTTGFKWEDAKSGNGTTSGAFSPVSTGSNNNVVVMQGKDTSPACMCDPEALTTAVIDRIYETDFKDASYEEDSTVADYNEMQKQLDKLKRYTARLKDTCLQSKYASVLELYQRDHDKGLSSLQHPEAPRKSDWDLREEAQKREVDKCKRDGTVPQIRGMSK
jgi:hypothetical protein